ncbi:glycosyl transferase family 25 [Neorhizobium galegae]|uniref:glycosyltransferase family 25 protein n=1 Tax=Neorhizobium galegae TaxID=399 RepID=UPI001AE6CE32|nr:glycosyltransferase family 25 protein [Neorhizobium galegae]MBP2547700.1 glycosyl transferase family 25 [Neorhizobium galegae]
MATETQLPVLLINIERAAARRRLIESQAQELGIRLVAVAGVDGAAVPQEAWQDVDLDLFRRRNGRPMMPGEYGCYRSHLNALAHLVESGQEAAIIIEDDVALSQDLMQRAAAIVDALPQDGVVKLVNHRTVGFRRRFASRLGDLVGYSRFGPQGSSACYVVTRRAAERLLVGMRPQSLPLDSALERSWDHGVPVYTTASNVIDFGALRNDTLIASQADYRGLKLRGLQKLPTHLFRVREALRRARYTLF